MVIKPSDNNSQEDCCEKKKKDAEVLLVFVDKMMLKDCQGYKLKLLFLSNTNWKNIKIEMGKVNKLLKCIKTDNITKQNDFIFTRIDSY